MNNIIQFQYFNNYLCLLVLISTNFFVKNDLFSQDPFITTWNTENAGSSCSSCITIPANGSGYNYDVDWDNDGNYDQTGITGSVNYNFNNIPGIYTIRIKGSYPMVSWGGVGDKLKLINIDQWGTQIWSSFAGAFSGCENMTCTATDIPDLSNVTSMHNAFSGTQFNNNQTPNWDVSNITNMVGMFAFSPFNQPIGNWNISNVIDIDGMFYYAAQFNQSLANWEFHSSIDVLGEFIYESGIDCNNYSATLAGWANNPNINTGIYLNASSRFYSTYVLNQRNYLINTKNWEIDGDTQSPDNCGGYYPCPSGNFVGINTSSPTNTLHVVACSDPLRLEGLLPGLETDSFLTVNSLGVVKKRSISISNLGGENYDDSKDYWYNFGNNIIFNQSNGNSIVGAITEGIVASSNSGSTIGLQKAKFTVEGGDGQINSITIGKGGSQFIQNTALGYQALFNNNAGGYFNTATGYKSLFGNTTGFNNTAYGGQTLENNTTGTDNVAIGYGALVANISGHLNTAVGHVALSNNVDGVANTSLGEASLLLNTSGSNNLALGKNSLYNNLSGNGNVAIGYETLSNLISGSNNIAIGLNAEVPSSISSNQLSIGNTIYGIGINGAVGEGNIGIGTNAPSNKLHISSPSDPLKLEGLNSGTSTDSVLTINSTTNVVKRRHLNAITNGLDDSKDYWYNTGNNSILNQTGGNAIIGSTTEVTVASSTSGSTSAQQLAKLTVTGGDGIINTLTLGKGGGQVYSNTALGVRALYDNTTGGNNSAFGELAMRKSTTGYSNSAFGVQALTNLTTGNNNTSLGAGALWNLSTGNFNVATGSSSLYNLTTGSDNSAFGIDALNNLTIGSNNIGIGKNAAVPNNTGNNQLSIGNLIYGTGVTGVSGAGNIMIGTTVEGTVASTTSGSSTSEQIAKFTISGGDSYFNSLTLGKGGGQVSTNTALGYQTLYNNLTTGNFNTAIGYLALRDNTSGDYNTSIGYTALSNSIASTNNTVFGAAAMGLSTGGSTNNAFGVNAIKSVSGNENCGFGTSTLFNLSSGSNNTAIGNNALDNLTTGSNNIGIGKEAQVPSNTSNNQLSIGNVIYGTGVTGISGAGNIGIGISSPSEKLQISGAIKISDGGYTGLTNNSSSPVPSGGAGTFVFSNGHFFGWTGSVWKQLDN